MVSDYGHCDLCTNVNVFIDRRHEEAKSSAVKDNRATRAAQR